MVLLNEHVRPMSIRAHEDVFEVLKARGEHIGANTFLFKKEEKKRHLQNDRNDPASCFSVVFGSSVYLKNATIPSRT
jgi:hypothetical protein